MSIKVLLVDDHPVFMAGIRAVLESKEEISIVGEANDGNQAIQFVKVKSPDVVVMDITMPNLNGIDATRQILEMNSEIKVLALSIHSGRRFVKNMLSAGAAGYLLKESAPEELVLAIQKVAKGEMYLSSGITSVALSNSISEQHEVKILTTKLNRPVVESGSVRRTEIIEYLKKNINKPLSVISAPVGYGKSTAVSQWVAQENEYSVWISLDEEHNNFPVFLNYFKAAVEKSFPSTLNNFSKMLMESELPSVHALTYALINELDRFKRKLILVLDNYHIIYKKPIHDFIEGLLRFPTENMHIVLVSRIIPPLNLNSLRIHNKLNEIGIKELSFSNSEIKEFFLNSKQMELNKEAIESLCLKTEGWIVGLRIASLAIPIKSAPEELSVYLEGDIHLVSEFLSKEILSNQSDKIKDLLFISAIVDRFNEELLSEIFSLENDTIEQSLDGEAFIDHLISSNLFIIPLDSNRKWFRFHTQFREVLLKNFKKRKMLDERRELHRIASLWFEKNDFVEEAIDQAKKTKDTDRIIEIVESNARSLIDRNMWHILSKWMKEVPLEAINKRPELLLAKAWVHMFNFDIEALTPIMDRIDLIMNNGSKKHELSGEVAYFRAHSSIEEFQDGNRSLEYLKEALRLISDKEVAFRGEAELLYGLAGQMEGISDKVINQINKWLFDPVLMAPFRETRLLLVLKFIHYIELKVNGIDRYLSRSRKITNNNNLHEANAWCDYIDGLCLLQRGNFVEAIVCFERIKERRFLFHARAVVDTLSALVIAYEISGNSKEANNTVKVLENYDSSMGSFFTDYIESCKSRLSFLRGSSDYAFNWVKNSNCKPVSAMLFWFEIPCLTRCRILILSGIDNDLKEASKLINEFERKNELHHNWLHQINILALKAILQSKQDKLELAFETMESSLALAESSDFIFPFIELGEDMANLIVKLPASMKKKKNIGNILAHISSSRKNWAIIRDKSSTEKDKHLPNQVKTLTNREIAVLKYVSSGMMNKEIANAMFVSDDTIKKHLYNMFQKMQVKNRLSLVSKAKRLKII